MIGNIIETEQNRSRTVSILKLQFCKFFIYLFISSGFKRIERERERKPEIMVIRNGKQLTNVEKKKKINK